MGVVEIVCIACCSRAEKLKRVSLCVHSIYLEGYTKAGRVASGKMSWIARVQSRRGACFSL